jgi:hypothetical protein
MKLTKAQYLTLSDVCREAAAVVFGGMVIGSFLAQQFKWMLSVIGVIAYLIFVYFAIYFKKKGE